MVTWLSHCCRCCKCQSVLLVDMIWCVELINVYKRLRPLGEVGKRCCVVIQCFETSHAPVFPSAGPLVRFGLLTRICATSGYPGEVSGHKGQCQYIKMYYSMSTPDVLHHSVNLGMNAESNTTGTNFAILPTLPASTWLTHRYQTQRHL